MPAIITHDQFGRKALAKAAAGVVSNERERNAFLLGNQGPDPLFYCVANPTTAKYHKLGNLMHHADPSALLFSLAQSLVYLPEAAHPLAKAYIAGFLCHYLLDRAEHPLVYAQQYALCDAGIDGLSDKDGSEVHAIIESDLDEMVLWTCEGKTVASFNPHKEILKADRQTLAIISYLVSMAVHDAYGKEVSPDLFTKSVLGFRRIQHVFHSPRGIKRTALGNIERKFRKHSFVQAMSHRAVGALLPPEALERRHDKVEIAFDFARALLRHLDGVGHAVEQRYGTLVLAALGIGVALAAHGDIAHRRNGQDARFGRRLVKLLEFLLEIVCHRNRPPRV